MNTPHWPWTIACASLVWFVLFAPPAAAGHPYDPLALPAAALPAVATPAPLEVSFRDAARDRELPLRIYLPAAAEPTPVVLFSHGLGGSRAGSAFLGRHWAARGYVAVFLQHPGSDESIWRDTPKLRVAALRRAASAENYLLRVQDVAAVLDQLDAWRQQADHALAGRVNLERVGMAGHSFGAQTTQAVSGQRLPLIGQRYTDPRIRAALVLSPSTPQRADPAQAFGAVKLPWLLMTGTHDVAPIGAADVAARLAVYEHLPAGDKYELVLDQAEHSIFTDRPLPGESKPRDPNHHRVILALSTAFWDAYLRDDAAARAWLAGDAPRALMAPADRWQRK